MGGEAAAARILNRIASKGAEQASGQGARLGTVKSVSPFVLNVDGVTVELTAAEVVINKYLVGFTITGKLNGEIKYDTSGSAVVSGTTNISGTGSVGPASGSVSISGNIAINGTAEESQAGTVSITHATFEYDTFIQAGDRVAVAPVGNNRWAVLCKVVTP